MAFLLLCFVVIYFSLPFSHMTIMQINKLVQASVWVTARSCCPVRQTLRFAQGDSVGADFMIHIHF